LSFCLGFAIGVGTAYTIVASEGRRCFSMFNAIPFVISFIFGVMYASKQGMFEPFFYVALTAVAFRYRIRGMHMALFVVLLFLAAFVFYPFGQSARNSVRGYGFKDTIIEAAHFIREHFSSVGAYKELLSTEANASPEQDAYNYFDKPVGLLERLSLIKMADLLVTATLKDGTSGWETVVHGFKMIPPRFIYPEKPVWNTGQVLAHKVGMLAEDDESTQVSFGFIPDAFSSFGWAGAFVIPFLLCLSFFLVYKWLLGSLTGSVWGIYFVVQLQHSFTEATIASMILTILYNPITYVVLYFAIEHLMKTEFAQAVFNGPLRRLKLKRRRARRRPNYSEPPEAVTA
jgi:hypothetical protein